jgi:hypothetical protein
MLKQDISASFPHGRRVRKETERRRICRVNCTPWELNQEAQADRPQGTQPSEIPPFSSVVVNVNVAALRLAGWVSAPDTKHSIA